MLGHLGGRSHGCRDVHPDQEGWCGGGSSLAGNGCVNLFRVHSSGRPQGPGYDTVICVTSGAVYHPQVREPEFEGSTIRDRLVGGV